MGAVILDDLRGDESRAALSFLLPYEHSCVQLVQFLVNPPEGTQFFALKVKLNINTAETMLRPVQTDFSQSKICALIMLAKNGTLLHCLPFTRLSDTDPLVCSFNIREIKEKLSALFSNYLVKTIIGDYAGSIFLQSCIRYSPQEARNYDLMTANSPLKISPSEEKLNLHRCQPDDTEELFDMEKAYYAEEIFQGAEQNDCTIKRLLYARLQKYTVFSIPVSAADKSRDTKTAPVFAAMAGTNAIGINWAQLGRVYTKPEYRNRGYAEFLTKSLVQYFAKKNMRCVLFVRCQNTAAKRAYEKSGFNFCLPYRLCYY